MVYERSNMETIVSPEESSENSREKGEGSTIILPPSPELLSSMHLAAQSSERYGEDCEENDENNEERLSSGYESDEISQTTSGHHAVDSVLAVDMVADASPLEKSIAESPDENVANVPDSVHDVSPEEKNHGDEDINHDTEVEIAAVEPKIPEDEQSQNLNEDFPDSEELARSSVLIPLEWVNDDFSLRLRPEGDIDSLATSLAKYGQLFPIDLREVGENCFQVVTGFRRIAALRLLKREFVLARIHCALSDTDALFVALFDALDNRQIERAELVELRDRLERENKLTPSLQEALGRAISPVQEVLEPETIPGDEQEVDLDDLAKDIIKRLAAINQDMALVMELWNAMDSEVREVLFEQLSYSEQLVKYLRSN